MEQLCHQRQVCGPCSQLAQLLLGPHCSAPCQIDHHPNLIAFLQSCKGCQLCAFIRDISLDNVRHHKIRIDESRYHTITVKIELQEVLVLDEGVSWALLRINLDNKSIFHFSTTVCRRSCMTPAYLSYLIYLMYPTFPNYCRAFDLTMRAHT
jgi:hypothetical protein